MKKNSFFLAAPFLVFLFVSLVVIRFSDAAAGGWQWQFNLASPEAQKPFMMPTSLYAEDKSGRFYVVDSGANLLHSFKFDGEFIKSFGPEGTLLKPFAMGREKSSGVLWVVEKGRNSLTMIDMKSKKLVPETLKHKGALVYPDRLSLADGKFYVQDKLSGNIIVYGPDLRVVEVYEGAGGFVDFVVKDADIWALDAKQRKVSRFKRGSKSEKEISLSGYELSFPVAIEIGPSGFVYILDKHQGTIVVFDSAGNFKYSFLQKGHDKTSLYLPEDLLFDPLGRLCVVDTGNGRVGVFSR